MRIYLDFLNDGRVSVINAANDEHIATGEYTRVMQLLYPLRVKVVQR